MHHILRTALGKRWLLAAVAAVLAFSSVYAFAATLNVSSNSLAAGNAAVSGCAASVAASYSVAYDSSIAGYRVSGVNLNNLTACSGKAITVDLTGTADASLAQVTYTVLAADAAAGNKTLTVAGGVPASALTGVSVAIAG